ncbi:MAG: hypothetical protein I4E98_12040 [Planktothrix agardhii KL2]|uniref:hypothetical protein n=1 Tax=Planktothrix agardhii TaxID=1160 RepID=UPI001A28F283|nr:hypothetical protein [Planktothrix agardhii]MBG0747310.1 hypothetical protein [Planktothrix agardhii KL2]
MNLKNIVIIVGLVILALMVIFGSVYVGRITAPNYFDLYSEQKAQREFLEQRVLKLTSENERVKANLQGGRSNAEEQEALNKREQELDRRESLLNKREDELITARVDLEEKMRDFYETIGTTREEVGRAKQIRMDYEDTKERLSQTLKERNNWRTWFYLLLVLLLVSALPLLFYFLRLRYLEAKSRKFIEMLETKLSNPSVSVDDVKTLTNTYLQLTDTNKSQKALKSGDATST